MEMNIKKFEEMNLYSYRTLEKIASSLINESSNAVLVNMFEDAVLLLDHKEGQFYLADYTFDHKKATFTFENFEPIQLNKTERDFKSDARQFFEGDEIGAVELAESYRSNVMDQDNFISDLITEAMVSKDFGDIVDYDELSKINEGTELANEKFFKSYQDRLSTHPTTSIKSFNWKSPVKVSLVETESANKIFFKTAAAKAHDLWKKDDFRTKFQAASSVFVENVEEGKTKFNELFEEYPQVFKLDGADRKTLFGKTIISNAQLRENRSDIVKGLDIFFEQELKDKIDVINEAAEGEAAEDPAPEITPEEIGKIADELKKLADKVEDEKVKEKLLKLAGDLGGAEEDIAPEDVKEAVEILSL